ncbi:MAG: DNA-directed RNA polymerase subunit H [Nanohaloarchaea archaeon]|nr:DNA-directed RNA polymerase subunit H [Candidatus Nanohaloarchaea archaeon]
MNDDEIKNHVLVPRHEILDAKEKETVLKKYNVTVEQLPKILNDDAAIKAFGAKVGDVVKITRESVTAGVSIYYRTVI